MSIGTFWEWALSVLGVLFLTFVFVGFGLALVNGIREPHPKKVVQQFDKDQPTRWLKPGSQNYTEKVEE